MSVFPDLDAQLAEIRRENQAAFHHLNQRLDIIMAKIDDDAAAVAGNTAQLRQITTNIQAAIEGQATIAAEVAALKAQIAAGTTPDTTALDAAVADQADAMSALAALAPAPTT